MDNNIPAQVCERCTPAPQGLEGHDMLRTEDLAPVPPGLVPFRCAICRAVWVRAYAGGGEFEWQQLPGHGLDREMPQ